jgi:hypothetical protein
VAVLLIYGIIASAQLRGGGAVLAWSNVCAMLLLDVLHYLLGRGGHHWAPGLDVALLATGRMGLSIGTGQYWLLGYSFCYVLYGYALTAAVIHKHLPHLSKAQAGAVAFLGQDIGSISSDMASAPEFAFGLLSFCFLGLLVVCAYARPQAFPLPDIRVGGMEWPVYIFGIAAFLLLLVSCLTRATFRAAYLSREGLLLGSYRDAYFWSPKLKLPTVLAAFTQVCVH